MFWSKSTNHSKKENVKELNKSLVISKSDGNIVTTSTASSFTRQISSSSHSSEVFSNEKIQFEMSSKSPTKTSFQDARKTMLDATPFKTQPYRSVFTTEPFTGRGRVALSPLDRSQPTRSSASRITPMSAIVFKKPDFESDEFRDKVQIKVIKSKEFCDDQNKSKTPVYQTRSKHKGQLLLINNVKFAKEAERAGAEFDEKNLCDLFKGIGFEITKYQNLTKKDMEMKIKKFRDNSILKKYDIAAVIIMSHGSGNDTTSTRVICSDDQQVDTSWIVNQFDGNVCKHLIGKPKIFIFQCCRGNNINTVQHDSVPIPVPRQMSDVLIAYSTVPGFVSHRDPNNGTWYIQAICKVFMEHAHDTDVESLLKIVDNKLSMLVAEGSKQTSSFENRGFKTCFLHPQLHE